MGIIVGLDIGIASVGWAVLDPQQSRIAGLGVRIFSRAENPKTGASLALPRRLARSARRRLHRRAERMAHFRQLLDTSGIAPAGDSDEIFTLRHMDLTPYELRVAGLDRRLDDREWARVLSQLCKRRGYNSTRFGDEPDSASSEEGAVKGAIIANAERMKERGYRTVGEMLWRDERFAESRRNKGDYKAVVSREHVLDEVHRLFAAQREYANPHASEELEAQYLEILRTQASILEGDAIRSRVGKCSIDGINPRIAQSCPTFEHFRVLDKLHNVRYTLVGSGIRVNLDNEQRAAVVSKVFSRATAASYGDIRKICALPDEARFVGVRYGSDDDLKAETKEKLPHPKSWHQMSKVLGEHPEEWLALSSDMDLMDSVAEVLTYFKSDESVTRELSALGLSEGAVEALSGLRFSKNGHLSRQTLRAILPHMEAGLPYSEACVAAGLHHSRRAGGEKQDRLPPIPVDEVRNPVVLRALSQSRKVLNAILEEYGPIDELHVELGREVAKSYEDRRTIEKLQKENRARNDSVIEDLENEFKMSRIGGHDIMKYKLWKEQGGRCAYSGEYIDPQRMLAGEPGLADVDHILPHARSFDDSYMNKVLVTGTANRNKRERTPFEYLGSDDAVWHEFEERVTAMHLPRAKRERLLRREFDERASEEFRDRNLIDTQYVARYFKGFVDDNLRFATDAKAPVVTVNGRATAYLRHAWHLQKVREESDLHHALDAAVVAATTRSMIQRVSRFFSVKPLRNVKGEYVDINTGEIIPAKHVPEPWEGFALQLKAAIDARFGNDPLGEFAASEDEYRPILVSRMANRSVRGEIHKETVRRIEGDNDKGLTRTSKRVRLEDLTLKTLDYMVGKERDRELYGALASRLSEHGGDAAKAFAEPFYKPTAPGKTAPRVRAIRVYDQPSSGGTLVRGGLADNGEMVRTDVFERDGKYYLVPIYLKDTVTQSLPSKAIVGAKPEALWREIDDSYRFVFSLYMNDPIRLVRKDGTAASAVSGYFKGTDRAWGSVHILSPDASWIKRGLGVAQNVLAFEKYQVDVLGREIHRVKRETRCGFSNGGDKQ